MFDRVDEAVAYIEAKRTKRTFFDFQKIITKYQLNTNLKNIIHVAGTNGKGSTTVFMRDLLMKQGYHVGTFTSPYIINHNERISVDGKPISDEDLLRIINQLYKMIEVEQLSMFEIDVCIMLVYFSRLQLDYHIIECGIGGLYDKTNVLDCEVAVITNIGMDHQEYLGDTLEQIAYEKSGIFKPEAIALTTEKDPSCQKVMELVANYLNVMLGFVSLSDVEKTSKGYKIIYNGVAYIADIPEYQIDNMILALETLFVLGYSISAEHIQKTMDTFSWTGRFTILRKDPLIIVDGAHNVPGIKALTYALGSFDGTIYFSVLKEKDAIDMIRELKKLNDKIVLVDFETDRLYPLEKLGLPIIAFDELASIIKNTKEKR